MRFYVYTLIGPDGAVFYVGKGQGKRMYQHRGEAKSGHGCHKCNKIRKLWREGGDYTELVVFRTDDEQEAFSKEIELIAATPNLCNATIGGEGAILTPEARERIAMQRAAQAALEDPLNKARFEVFEARYEEQKEIKKQAWAYHFKIGLAELDRKLKEARKARRLESQKTL